MGGFTIWSAPSLLTRCREISLAIKYSRSPPSHWIHTQCQVGDSVAVRSGGTFYYEPKLDKKMSDLVLIAGGVGITPIISMIQHFSDIFQSNPLDRNLPNQVSFLYSAQSKEEILFKVILILHLIFIIATRFDDLNWQDTTTSIKQNIASFQYQYFITRQSLEVDEESTYKGTVVSHYIQLFVVIFLCLVSGNLDD